MSQYFNEPSLNRVVVTGIGVISPLGLSLDILWQNLIAGVSGIRPITLFDTSDFDVRIAGEAHDFDPTNYMSRKEARRVDRFVQFAIAALDQVLAQSRLVITDDNADQIGAIVGSGVGGIWTYSGELDVLRSKGPRWVSPFLILSITIDTPSAHVTLRTGARGPSFGIGSACATSAVSVGEAYETIRRGHAKAMFAGGFEAAVTPIGIASFDRMRALSHRNAEPAKASCPFDLDRDGFIMSEGGAILILEESEFALKRGAEPLAEIIGYAGTSDAQHITSPDPEGKNAAHCMKLAIQRAGISPKDIDYVNAHGTSTPSGDPAETAAIKKALGAAAYEIPVSSTKSMTGHLLGGAGALETAICIQTIRQNIIPPTINLENSDPTCDLDYVPTEARKKEVNIALTNSFGFGGHNATLILKGWG